MRLSDGRRVIFALLEGADRVHLHGLWHFALDLHYAIGRICYSGHLRFSVPHAVTYSVSFCGDDVLWYWCCRSQSSP